MPSFGRPVVRLANFLKHNLTQRTHSCAPLPCLVPTFAPLSCVARPGGQLCDHVVSAAQLTRAGLFWAPCGPFGQLFEFPNIYALYQRIMHIQASSAIVERLFSFVGQDDTPRRSSMGYPLMSALALLGSNMDLW